MVTQQTVTARSGKTIPCRLDTICVHGDEPTAVDLAHAVRDGLVAAGVDVVPLTEMDLG